MPVKACALFQPVLNTYGNLPAIESVFVITEMGYIDRPLAAQHPSQCCHQALEPFAVDFDFSISLPCRQFVRI